MDGCELHQRAAALFGEMNHQPRRGACEWRVVTALLGQPLLQTPPHVHETRPLCLFFFGGIGKQLFGQLRHVCFGKQGAGRCTSFSTHNAIAALGLGRDGS